VICTKTVAAIYGDATMSKSKFARQLTKRNKSYEKVVQKPAYITNSSLCPTSNMGRVSGSVHSSNSMGTEVNPVRINSLGDEAVPVRVGSLGNEAALAYLTQQSKRFIMGGIYEQIKSIPYQGE